jgi:hypothetical protein
MLMTDISDYAAKNMRSKYCRYCANAEGMLQSPQERLAKLTAFIMEDENISEEAAREKAIKQMRKMPAWKGKV